MIKNPYQFCSVFEMPVSFFHIFHKQNDLALTLTLAYRLPMGVRSEDAGCRCE
jgi:hypothetical protein